MSTLNIEHLQHLTESAISLDIAALNFYSWDANDENAIDNVFDLLVDNPKYRNNGTLSGRANNALANVIRAGGWVFEGHIGISVKPDHPRKVDGDPIKYESVRGSQQLFVPRVSIRAAMAIAAKVGVDRGFDVTLNTNSEDLDFWDWFLSTGLPLIVTEGCKKACSVVSAGYPAIALNGVYGWGSNNRDVYGNIETDDSGNRVKTIFSAITPFIADREIVTALDFDKKRSTVAYVRRALQQFVTSIADVPSSVSQLRWTGSKGIDDLIVAKGVKKLDLIYSERKLMKNEAAKEQKIGAKELAVMVVGAVYKDLIRHESETNQYWRYRDGLWIATSDDRIFAMIQDFLDTIEGLDYGARITHEVIQLAKRSVLIDTWLEAESTEFIPFENGVYRISDKTMLPHSPSYGFKWQMPRKYVEGGGSWDNIDLFLTQFSNNNPQLKDILLAFCNAALLGKSNLQKFLYLSGSGRNGKGTFIHLMTELVGDENKYSTSIASLCDNRFTAANIRNKRLVTCPDENKKPDDIGIFKSATGMDNIECEFKGKQSVNFIFRGIFVVSANKPTFHGDNNVAIKERKVDFPCQYKPVEEDRRDLKPGFLLDMSAFTTHVLSLDPDWVRKTIINAGKIDVVRQLAHEMSIRENNIEAYFDERMVADPDSSVQALVLYRDYKTYCEENGTHAKSMQNFTPLLMELCNDTLGLGITKKRTKMHVSLKGLRFANPLDEFTAPFDAERCIPDIERCIPGVGVGVGVERIQGKGSVGGVGTIGEKSHITITGKELNKINAIVESGDGQSTYTPTPNQAKDSQDKGSSRVYTSTPSTPPLLKVGDRVWVAKYNENGTVEAILPSQPPIPHGARVIRDSGKPCLVDILPGEYKLIAESINAT